MLFYYLQLKHAVTAQRSLKAFEMSPTPIFNYMQQSSCTKGFISNCYTMLLGVYLENFPNSACEKWERDVGDISGDLWEEAPEAVWLCSLSMSHRLHSMGLRPNLICTRCNKDVGDLIHLVWKCPKLHRYWSSVVTTVNTALQVSIPLDPKHCILSMLDATVTNRYAKEADTSLFYCIGPLTFPQHHRCGLTKFTQW